MPLKLDCFPPDHAAIRQIVADTATISIGRDHDCSFRLDHVSVSRRHARFYFDGESWWLQDLSSKNGSFVDGKRVVGETRLPELAHLRFGDVHADCSVIDEDEVTHLRLTAARRRKTVAEHSIGLHSTESAKLIQRTLDSMVELVEADRGFVLVPTADGLTVAAHVGVHADAEGRVRFCGSVTQVNRAVLLKTALVTNSVASLPPSSRSQSLSGGAIASLLAWPLVHDNEVLAAIYVDHVSSPRTIDELDLELLAAFTEQATLCIASERRRMSLELMAGHANSVSASGATNEP